MNFSFSSLAGLHFDVYLREPWKWSSSTARSAPQRSHKQPEPRHGKSKKTWRCHSCQYVIFNGYVVRYKITVYKFITEWIHVDMKIYRYRYYIYVYIYILDLRYQILILDIDTDRYRDRYQVWIQISDIDIRHRYQIQIQIQIQMYIYIYFFWLLDIR